MDYNQKYDDNWFVIGMEILDNMPHDRLYRDGKAYLDPWQYQAVVDLEDDKLVEKLEPISDPWYENCKIIFKNMNFL